MWNFLEGTLKFLGGLLILAGIAAAILYGFFVRVVVVGHNAMAPNVIVGDRVLVWRGQDFELGDVVLCPHPRETGRFVMGRIVGKPGQTVEIGRGSLRINGEEPDRDMRGTVEFYDAERGRKRRMQWGIEDILDHEFGFFQVAGRPTHMRPHRVQGGVFLLSDNRSYVGEDSRSFHEVQPATCVGSIFMRLTAASGDPPEIPHGSLDLLE